MDRRMLLQQTRLLEVITLQTATLEILVVQGLAIVFLMAHSFL
jgi:hypothetical protein